MGGDVPFSSTKATQHLMVREPLKSADETFDYPASAYRVVAGLPPPPGYLPKQTFRIMVSADLDKLGGIVITTP